MNMQEIVYGLARDYFQDYASQLSADLEVSVSGMIRARDLSGLAECASRHDVAKHTSTDFRFLRQMAAFFKKNVVFSDADSCEQAALDSFRKSEVVCSIANKRLDYFSSHPDRLDPDMRQKIEKMEAFIQKVLGDRQEFVRSLTELIRVTPGATATLPRKKSLPPAKLSRRVDCSPGVVPLLSATAKLFGYSGIKGYATVTNRVELVPKNWKTHRTIACEPTGNVPFQLAFDTFVKERLGCKTKVNLRDQSRNQELARIGSIDGSLATIDLSAASDTLAFNAVAWLLPRDWFEFCNRVRSPFYRLDGKLLKYHKFSSMGNGMTFVLESLVFAAACNAVGSKTMCVYGDDIIIETCLVDELISLLAFFGFSTNQEKSFAAGPFRESCGADYLDGVNVTPFYLREWPKLDDRPSNRSLSTLCHIVNGLVAIGLPEGRLWKTCAGLISQYKLPLVPFSYSTNLGVSLDIGTAYSKKKLKSTRHQILKTQGFVPESPTIRFDDGRSLFLWHLDALGRSESCEPTVLPHERLSHEAPKASYLQRSRVPTGYVKYVRKWVRWHMPAKAVPIHLFWWSDYVARALER